MSATTDIAVVGAGLVGAAAALGLARAGWRVTLIDRAAPAVPGDDWDARVYAIAPSSRHLLESLGVWSRLDAGRVQPVWRMDVAGDAGARVVLDAYRAGTGQLADIVENGRLQHALWQALDDEGTVDRRCPAALDAIDFTGTASELRFANGDTLRARLVLGADGRASRVRAYAGLAVHETPYGQRGVVANFSCARPHRGTAFQWFDDADVVALLPLAGKRVSLVWSCADTRADALTALPADALAARVETASHGRLGALEPLTAPQSFSLALARVPRIHAPGCLLIGDAAHGVHPLAGQGVNLGFGDVSELLATLGERRIDPGDAPRLAAYARRRAEPVATMQAVTHGLYHLFAYPQAQRLRNAGFGLVNRAGPLKSALVRQALA